MDHLCYLYLVFFFEPVLCCIVVGLTAWLLFVPFYCVFVTFPCGILGQVWYLIVSIPDLCRLSYFHMPEPNSHKESLCKTPAL